jgi:hypothetical protein
MRGALWIVGLAIALRAVVFPFAENKHGDAPMRALAAERMNDEPGTGWNPRTYCQFGPLHAAAMRPFLALDRDARRSSRYLSFLAGIAAFVPFFRLARRLVGPAHAHLAGFAMALSPLHIQASTTAASEALYVLLILTCLERLLAALESGRKATYLVAGALASLAAITRYDAWLAFPISIVAGGWLFARADQRQPARATLTGLVIFAAMAALLPVAWIAWGWVATDDPFFFAHYITTDHAGLAAAVNARFGPVLARARAVGIWAISFAAAMSIPMMVAAAVALRRARSFSAPMKLVVITALAPPCLYLVKGLLFLTFEPLSRFALIPGVLLLPLAASVVSLPVARRWPVGIAGTAVAMSVVVMIVAWSGPGRIWAGAESLAPVTRLDDEDRRLASFLGSQRAPTETVFLDTLQFSDIVITHAARIPAARSMTLVKTRMPAATVAESAASTGARWLAAHDLSWGPRLQADWPTESQRIGGWRVVRVGR